MFVTPVVLAVITGSLSLAVELLGVITRSKSLRRFYYFGVVVFAAFSSVLIMGADLCIATVLIALVTFFRVINALRVIELRMKEPRLSRASRRTSLYLIGLQIFAVGLWIVSVEFNFSTSVIVYFLAVISLLFSLVILISTRRNLAKSAIRPSDKYHSDEDLPSVSVCIPARNETNDLPACLESVVASDYPKLEVLVLDDCSQDRTSEIIKGFAQKGVRFIPGEAPDGEWLAKNQAYQALAEAASGEVLIFCGVDTRFDKHAVRALISSMIVRKKQMISLLPRSSNTNLEENLIQPMRYWWELALPRRIFNRPPVLSTVWSITRHSFFNRGGMQAVKNSVTPEGFLAREITKSDEYSFMRASGKLMVRTAKKLPEQWDTALRVRYPSLRKRPENVLLLLIAEMWVLVLPFCLFIWGFFWPMPFLWLIAGTNFLILLFVHKMIIEAWNKQSPSLMLALFPVAIFSEMIVVFVSMWRYEFSKVEWKDRNICIPVMQHHDRLPKA